MVVKTFGFVGQSEVARLLLWLLPVEQVGQEQAEQVAVQQREPVEQEQEQEIRLEC